MSDNKFTDAEIIKALECFAIDKDFDETHCIGCAFEHQFCTANMSEDIAKPALYLINRQKAEIERLKESRDKWKGLAKDFDEASRETDKEIDRLNEALDKNIVTVNEYKEMLKVAHEQNDALDKRLKGPQKASLLCAKQFYKDGVEEMWSKIQKLLGDAVKISDENTPYESGANLAVSYCISRGIDAYLEKMREIDDDFDSFIKRAGGKDV